MTRPGRLFLPLGLFIAVAAAAQAPPCDLKPVMPLTNSGPDLSSHRPEKH